MVNEQQITELKKKIEALNGKQIKAETRMEQLQEQQKEIEKEVVALGFDPRTLGDELTKMDQEMDQLFGEIQELMPNIAV